LIYFSAAPAGLLFAVTPSRFTISATAPLDRLALGEIARFGAVYGDRTPIQGIRQVPFAHVLQVSSSFELSLRSSGSCFSHEPDERLTRLKIQTCVKEAIRHAVNLVPGDKEVLFSGGVDSTVIAAIASAQGQLRRGWFLATKGSDREREIAQRLADHLGFKLEIVPLHLSFEDIVRIIRSYSTPTLDFSSLPTHFAGSAIADTTTPATVFDGTGGDAGFGFESLARADLWRGLQPLHKMSASARTLYLVLVEHDRSRLISPLRTVARLSDTGHVGLSYLCGSPLYGKLLALSRVEWRQVEDSVSAVWRRLVNEKLHSAAGQVLTVDKTMIAINQFAAKTGQWSLANRIRTVYPFLSPELVEISRRIPSTLLVGPVTTKLILKEILVDLGVPKEVAFRNKTGFTPRLVEVFSPHHESVRETITSSDELDDILTPEAMRISLRLLEAPSGVTSLALSALWTVFSFKTWVRGLRAREVAVF
jgi:asparagine synthetase B (glutamine-hydrolysing)